MFLSTEKIRQKIKSFFTPETPSENLDIILNFYPIIIIISVIIVIFYLIFHWRENI